MERWKEWISQLIRTGPDDGRCRQESPIVPMPEIASEGVSQPNGCAAGDMAAVPPEANSANFLAVGRLWATSVAVVTTIAEHGQPHGMTMSAVTTLSLDPIQFLICPDHRARPLAHLLRSGLFCINVLGANQAAIASRFASRRADRFEGVSYRVLDCGLPGVG
jgi:flavin reductase (DIM6/NTAB) family NADH-FMN oxidoreductase RutF